jgi:PAS domain S-box-containing protein
VLVLIGWAFDVSVLERIASGRASMKPNTAMTFVLSGLALGSFAGWGKAGPGPSAARFAPWFAAAAAVLPLLTLAEYALGTDLRVDQLVFNDRGDSVGPSFPGRMSPQVALCLLIVSISLLSLRSRAERWVRVLDALMLLPVMGFALLSATAYLYQVPALQSGRGYPGLALHSALTMLVLAGGTLAARDERGILGFLVSRTAGGAIGRRVLPWVVVVPLGLGWLRFEAQRAGLFGTEFGLTLFAVTNVFLLALLLWWSAASVEEADAARLRTTAELEVTETQYHKVFFDSPVALYRTSPEGDILDVNAALVTLLGYPDRETLLGGNSTEYYVDPHDRKRFSERLERENQVEAMVTQLKKRDGTPFWVLDTSHIVRGAHGGAAWYEGCLIDITELRNAENALRVSEERFRQMAEHIKEAFFIVEVGSGRPLYVSPTWSEIWGRPIEEGYDPSIWFNSIHPDDRSVMAAAQEGIKRGESSVSIFRITRPDGTLRWVRGRAFPVRDASGDVYRLVGVSEDITELRETEERLNHAQRMEVVGRLAGGVAHDFNNLLTVIIAETEYLRDELPASAPLGESVTEISRAGERAAALTRQLLAFSRRHLVEAVVFDLNPVVADTVKMLQRLVGEDVRLDLRPAADALPVRADRGQIEQLLTNLAVNARDAMPAGGTLAIETAAVRLDSDFAAAHAGMRPGDYVVLVVSDTGTGMTKEVMAHMFEPFFTTKELGKGTGLGLATSHEIVKEAGGHIAVSSEPGIGTTFRVYLPLVAGGTPTTAAPVIETIPRGDETVLLVEDDTAVRRLAARVLRDQGYDVVEASDGSDALRLLAERESDVDLLLTDVVLPGMGGRELAERVRESQPGVRTLFVSGYSDDVILQRQLLARDVVVLQKPFTRDALCRKVRDVIDSRDRK